MPQRTISGELGVDDDQCWECAGTLRVVAGGGKDPADWLFQNRKVEGEWEVVLL